jgi:hypothetical protein
MGDSVINCGYVPLAGDDTKDSDDDSQRSRPFFSDTLALRFFFSRSSSFPEILLFQKFFFSKSITSMNLPGGIGRTWRVQRQHGDKNLNHVSLCIWHVLFAVTEPPETTTHIRNGLTTVFVSNVLSCTQCLTHPSGFWFCGCRPRASF